MRHPRLAAAALILALLPAAPAPAQEPAKPAAAATNQEPAKPAAAATASRALPADAVTHHHLTLAGGELAYTSTAGTLPLQDDKGERVATVFYVAHTLDGAKPAERPVTFVFNGGPGAASAYLQLGALGPEVLDFGSGPGLATSPAAGDNPATWLDFTDLVFIDPVGTGYSRATPGEDAAKTFWGVRQDRDATAAAIRLYLTRSDRMASPVYLAGESYGGFRAAQLAYHLATHQGIALSGVVMISPVIEFALIDADDFNPLPWALRLPSYAAVALAAKGALTPEALAPIERYALGDYVSGLIDGPRDAAVAAQLYATVARDIGLPQATVERWHGKVPVGAFIRDFRRAEGEVLSRYDGTIASLDPFPASEALRADDPVLEGTRAAFTASFVRYARDTLGFKTDLAYELLNREISQRWDWHSQGGIGGQGYAGVSDELRQAVALNPALKVLIAHGMTDLTTPYLTDRYLVEHLPPGIAKAVTLKLYRGGHMMYLRAPARAALHDDAQALYAERAGK